MLSGVLRTIRQVLSREITLGHAYHYIMMRILPNKDQYNDDFNWNLYPKLYREELKGIERVHTLIVKTEDFRYVDGQIQQVKSSAPPLHPNHQFLYEVVLGLRPESVLEVGCGGGDHLHNLHAFNPSIELHGIDRSEGQLDTLRERHPDLSATVGVVDLTDSNATLPLVDLTYSHAVLMHISETHGRFDSALRNVLRSAKRHVVMIDNWTEHDFLAHIQKSVAADPNWAGATISFATFRGAPELTALVLSKDKVPYPELLDYDSLLQGKELRTH